LQVKTYGSALLPYQGLIYRANSETYGDLIMISRSRVWLIFMITLAIILAQANLASSQNISIGGKAAATDRVAGPAIGYLKLEN
jgi:hypothetical protein